MKPKYRERRTSVIGKVSPLPTMTRCEVKGSLLAGIEKLNMLSHPSVLEL